MRKTIDDLRILSVIAPLLASIACGNHGLPSAPSSAVSASNLPPTSLVSGATIVGTVNVGSNSSQASSRTLGLTAVTVSVVDTTVSAAVDSGGGFTLLNVPPIQVVLNFSGPGVNASVPIGVLGNDDHVQVGVTVSGTTATLDTLTSTTPTSSAVSMRGAVGAITGACPSLSLSVAGTTVRTSGATAFTGKSCVDVKTGDTAEVVGTKGTDGTVLATTVGVAKPTTTPPPAPPTPPPTPPPTSPPPTTVTMNGTINGLTGTCPSLTMSVSGTYVRTGTATSFTGKGCADLRSGDAIGVVGTRQTDTTVLATTIASTAPPPPPTTVTMNGTINGLAGTCPSLTMSVSGTYVRTNSATVFSGKSCGELKAGNAISVSGARQSDTTVLAATVSASK